MSGEKLEQAKAALVQILASLGRQDRFRLIAFSNRVRAHQSEWSRATRSETRRAQDWIERLSANGGTNIEGALAEAFRLESDEGRLPIVIFLTDGLPSVGEENHERLARQAEQLQSQTRIIQSLEGRLDSLEQKSAEEVEARLLAVEPRPVVQLVETLWEQPMPSLVDVEPGTRLRLRVEHVNPRAGLLSLRLL